MIDYFIVLLGFAIGILVGLTSCGVGFMGTPALILLFGISPQVAVATELTQGAIMKVFGAAKHISQKTAEIGLAVPFIIGGIPFAYMGSQFGGGLSEHTMRLVLGAVLVIISLLFLWEIWKEAQLKSGVKPEVKDKKTLSALFLGAIIGFVAGLSSIGTGIMMIAAMLLIFKLPPTHAVGTNILVGAVILGVAAFTHTLIGNVNFLLVGNLLMGSIPGILIGSQYSTKVSVKKLRSLIAILILLAGLKFIIT